MVDIAQRLLRKIAFVAPGGYTIRPLLHRLRGVTIGKHVWISQYVYIDEIHPEAINIGDNTTIGLGSTIVAHFYWGPKRSQEHAGKVQIDNDVFIGPHCVVLPGVHVGAGSVIQAGTVVSRDVPANTLWGLPKAGPLANVTVPLTHQHSYDTFIRGLRPIRTAASNDQ
jgi:acetyltransferase-like isoleucine patch superfamily enzyme